MYFNIVIWQNQSAYVTNFDYFFVTPYYRFYKGGVWSVECGVFDSEKHFKMTENTHKKIVLQGKFSLGLHRAPHSTLHPPHCQKTVHFQPGKPPHFRHFILSIPPKFP